MDGGATQRNQGLRGVTVPTACRRLPRRRAGPTSPGGADCTTQARDQARRPRPCREGLGPHNGLDDRVRLEAMEALIGLTIVVVVAVVIAILGRG
jgi:hypothetical protein